MAPDHIVSGKEQLAFVAIDAVVSVAAARPISGKRHLPFVTIDEVVSVEAVAADPDVDAVASLTTDGSMCRADDGLRASASPRT